MSAYETAKLFFAACETAQGWAGCAQYVEPGAAFDAQSEPLMDVRTVEAYCEWMKAFGTVTAPGANYDLHACAWDETQQQAMFFATYHATHSGEGGPVPPTQRSTQSHYVYVLTMNAEGKVAHMVKIWNAGWASRELGWIE